MLNAYMKSPNVTFFFYVLYIQNIGKYGIQKSLKKNFRNQNFRILWEKIDSILASETSVFFYCENINNFLEMREK